MTFWIFPYFRKLNTAITNWVQDRHNTNTSAKKVALYLRPFLFWLDKTLNGLLTDGFAHAEETSPEEEVVDLRIPESFDTSVFANFPSNNLAAKSEPNIESSATSSSGKEKEKKNENGDAKVETDKKVEEEQGVNTADVHQQEFSLEGVEEISGADFLESAAFFFFTRCVNLATGVWTQLEEEVGPRSLFRRNLLAQHPEEAILEVANFCNARIGEGDESKAKNQGVYAEVFTRSVLTAMRMGSEGGRIRFGRVLQVEVARCASSTPDYDASVFCGLVRRIPPPSPSPRIFPIQIWISISADEAPAVVDVFPVV